MIVDKCVPENEYSSSELVEIFFIILNFPAVLLFSNVLSRETDFSYLLVSEIFLIEKMLLE